MQPTSKARPSEFFSVSESVIYLDADRMREFEAAFSRWKDAARRADSVLARQRMWLIFLLLRHTGARLGEILSLDDTTAFDAEGKVVRLGRDGRVREVPLPESVFKLVAETLESPMGCGLRGQFFHVDPGYFRRTCYARGQECGLTKEQVCPRTLRNTRAVEMLRGGVPLRVVGDILGQSSLDLTANFQQFSKQDARSIVDSAHQSMRKRTSARNSFVGHVVKVSEDAVMAEVVMETRSGVSVSAVITVDSLRKLKIVEGSPVIGTIKAPLVNVLRRGGCPEGSACNRLPATVVRVNSSPAVAEILGRLADGTDVCALISAGSAEHLALNPGDEVEFWFKALSVVLNSVQT